MMPKLAIVATLMLFVFLSYSGLHLRGEENANEIMYSAGEHNISDDIIVEKGDVLVIEAGARLCFKDCGIVVNGGKIQIRGEVENKVILSCKQFWRGIRVTDGEVVAENAIVQGTVNQLQTLESSKSLIPDTSIHTILREFSFSSLLSCRSSVVKMRNVSFTDVVADVVMYFDDSALEASDIQCENCTTSALIYNDHFSTKRTQLKGFRARNINFPGNNFGLETSWFPVSVYCVDDASEVDFDNTVFPEHHERVNIRDISNSRFSGSNLKANRLTKCRVENSYLHIISSMESCTVGLSDLAFLRIGFLGDIFESGNFTGNLFGIAETDISAEYLLDNYRFSQKILSKYRLLCRLVEHNTVQITPGNPAFVQSFFSSIGLDMKKDEASDQYSLTLSKQEFADIETVNTVNLSGKIDVNEDIVINRGEKVIVQPGTEITFSKRCGIRIDGGILDCQGSEKMPVVLRAKEKEWGGIVARNGQATLNNVRISGKISQNLVAFSSNLPFNWSINKLWQNGVEMNLSSLVSATKSRVEISNSLIEKVDADLMVYLFDSEFSGRKLDFKDCSVYGFVSNAYFSNHKVKISQMSVSNLSFRLTGSWKEKLMKEIAKLYDIEDEEGRGEETHWYYEWEPDPLCFLYKIDELSDSTFNSDMVFPENCIPECQILRVNNCIIAGIGIHSASLSSSSYSMNTDCRFTNIEDSEVKTSINSLFRNDSWFTRANYARNRVYLSQLPDPFLETLNRRESSDAEKNLFRILPIFADNEIWVSEKETERHKWNRIEKLTGIKPAGSKDGFLRLTVR